MRKIKCLIGVCIIVIFLSLNLSAQEIDYTTVALENKNCKEDTPTDLIRVTVQQIYKKEPAYVFLLTNLSDLPIHSFVVGEGKMYDLNKWFVAPTKMEAPDGWEARRVASERSYYAWLGGSITKEEMILPGKSSSDFRIYFPEGTSKDSNQEKFKDLPFRVSRYGGYCLWGIIKTVDYMD